MLLPHIAPEGFQKLDEIDLDHTATKRADFLISLPSAYIIIECKVSLMSPNVSTSFEPEGVAKLYLKFHNAIEQISATVKVLKLIDKPVIPLVLSFFDAITASITFECMVKETNYCLALGLTIPPIIHSLHEFEHWTCNRSLENWAQLKMLQAKEPCLVSQNKQELFQLPAIQPDDKGHNYEHIKKVEPFKFNY